MQIKGKMFGGVSVRFGMIHMLQMIYRIISSCGIRFKVKFGKKEIPNPESAWREID